MMVWIGALLPSWLLFLLARKIARKFITDRVSLVLYANAAALAVGTVLTALGRADGGEPQYLLGFVQMVVPQAFWTIFYLVREIRQRPENAAKGAH